MSAFRPFTAVVFAFIFGAWGLQGQDTLENRIAELERKLTESQRNTQQLADQLVDLKKRASSDPLHSLRLTGYLSTSFRWTHTSNAGMACMPSAEELQEEIGLHWTSSPRVYLHCMKEMTGAQDSWYKGGSALMLTYWKPPIQRIPNSPLNKRTLICTCPSDQESDLKREYLTR